MSGAVSSAPAAHAADAALHDVWVLFQRYSRDDGSGRFMAPEDFIVSITSDSSFAGKLRRMFQVADNKGRGKLAFEEFAAFESLINRADAEYALAHRLFDRDGDGLVSFDEFKVAAEETLVGDSSIPFDYNTEWVKQYYARPDGRLSYVEFTQLLRGLQEERARQAFRHFAGKRNHISSEDFVRIVSSVRGNKLSPFVRARLPVLASLHDGANRVCYSHFEAFNRLLSSLDVVARAIRIASAATSDGTVTRDELLRATAAVQRFDPVTPMEIDILFQLADTEHRGRLTERDLARLLPDEQHEPLMPAATQDRGRAAQQQQQQQQHRRTALAAVLEQVEHFGLGAVAGATGATAVYPIDLVKTRMQNQRTGRGPHAAPGPIVGQLLYKNSFDCFQKVVRNEGIAGLYRGIGPQLVGVAPEKAIKLTVNDYARKKFTNPATGQVPLPFEIIAGGCAGGSQVIFTNPLEIVKIRLQTAGERMGVRKSAMQHVRELGLLGMYKGAAACAMRDVPFSAIYFTVYSHAKAMLNKADPTAPDKWYNLLTAGALAGIPAASLVTPADVIKTRLQVVPQPGQTTYSSIPDAARKIWLQEGFRAFWKGAAARVFRSSPQFGVTLATYELLQRGYNDLMGRAAPARTAAAAGPESARDLERTIAMAAASPAGGSPEERWSRRAWNAFKGVENKFGLWVPGAPPRAIAMPASAREA